MLMSSGGVAEELDDEERVAVGSPVDGGEGGVVELGAGHGDETSQRRDVETGQVVASRGRSAAQLDEGVSERGTDRQVDVAERSEGEDRDVVERAGQDGEHVERRGIGPVQVVEHHDEWLVTRQASQGGRDRLPEPEACRLWVLGWWRFEVGHELLHRWDHRREVSGSRSEGVGDGSPVAPVEEVSDDLHPWPERRSAASLVAASPGDDRAGLCGLVGDLLDEARLADAGLTGDEGDSASSGANRGQIGAQCRHVVGAADQREAGRGAVTGGRRRSFDRRPFRCGDGRGIEGWVLVEDGHFERAQLGAGFDAELLEEDTPSLLVRLQRVGLPSTPVQGDDELGVEALVERMVLDERGELGDHGRVLPDPETAVDEALVSARHELTEAYGGLPCEAELVEVAQDGTADQAERRREALCRRGGVIGAGLATGPDESLEADGIDVVGTDGQEVALTAPFDGVTAEQSTEAGDLGLQRVRRVARQVVVPHLVDQPLGGDRVG